MSMINNTPLRSLIIRIENYDFKFSYKKAFISSMIFWIILTTGFFCALLFFTDFVFAWSWFIKAVVFVVCATLLTSSANYGSEYNYFKNKPIDKKYFDIIANSDYISQVTKMQIGQVLKEGSGVSLVKLKEIDIEENKRRAVQMLTSGEKTLVDMVVKEYDHD